MRLPFGLTLHAIHDAASDNPFANEGTHLVIAAVDALATTCGFGHLYEASVAPFDLVIFDQAHRP